MNSGGLGINEETLGPLNALYALGPQKSNDIYAR